MGLMDRLKRRPTASRQSMTCHTSFGSVCGCRQERGAPLDDDVLPRKTFSMALMINCIFSIKPVTVGLLKVFVQNVSFKKCWST